MWAEINEHHRTPVYHVQSNLNGHVYRNQILSPLVVPMLRQIGTRAVLQDGNSPLHRAWLVDAFLQQAQINRMD